MRGNISRKRYAVKDTHHPRHGADIFNFTKHPGKYNTHFGCLLFKYQRIVFLYRDCKFSMVWWTCIFINVNNRNCQVALLQGLDSAWHLKSIADRRRISHCYDIIPQCPSVVMKSYWLNIPVAFHVPRKIPLRASDQVHSIEFRLSCLLNTNREAP